MSVMSYSDIRLFATDLDGTLFSTFGTLSSDAQEALRSLRARGIIVVVSTGRPFYSVRNTLPDDLYDYAACMNGQDIYIRSEDRHILYPELTEEDVSYLRSCFRRFPLVMNAATAKRSVYICSPLMSAAYFVRDIPRNIRRLLKGRPFVKRDITRSFADIDGQPIAKLCFSGTPGTLRSFLSRLEPERFSCFFVNSHWMEIMSAGISKGEALRCIRQMEKISKEQCAAIGDGENDIPLLQEAGIKVAMKNAMPSLKAIADETALSAQDDGCAKWIQEKLLNR